MDLLRAKEIIAALAEGINPITGEILPAEDSCNQGDVVRAYYAILSTFNEKEKSKPENAGLPWTEQDDETLCDMYEEGKSRSEMCQYFKRSQGAIAARLVRLGVIPNRDAFRQMK